MTNLHGLNEAMVMDLAIWLDGWDSVRDLYDDEFALWDKIQDQSYWVDWQRDNGVADGLMHVALSEAYSEMLTWA